MHRVIPGILEKTEENLVKKLQIIEPFSRAVHIDILDGKFASEGSFNDAEFFKRYKNDFYMEAHLMVDDPMQYLKIFADAGFNKFIGHIEKMKDIDEFVALAQILGEVSIGVDIDTSLENIKLPLNDLDEVLFMGVKAGKSGQEFIPEVLEKIKKVRAISDVNISIDGGINDKTILDAKNAGANRFVSTSFIFNSEDPMQSYERLLSLV